MSKAKIASFSFSMMMLCMVLTPAGLLAQVPMQQGQQQQQETPDYSDEQLQAFVSTTEDIMEIQESYQEKMVSAIEDEGLTAEEFQSMSQQGQQQGAEQEGMSEEKKESYANAMNSVVSIQQEMQQEMQTAVEDNDMAVEEYQQMSMHVQQSPELSQKVDRMLRSDQEQN